MSDTLTHSVRNESDPVQEDLLVLSIDLLCLVKALLRIGILKEIEERSLLAVESDSGVGCPTHDGVLRDASLDQSSTKWILLDCNTNLDC